ncbi:hypothetical protein [Alkalicoccobacillus gibsonii]|jgi:hypothetical protein|uniref:hypothetical protein n=1 Tax=Alkalicoccobacillus gibsonii TaxID=79881 RepID=UPI0019338A51|nr:hypothetical protein [Alkalicoccobacillus gibsonii]MBM0067944.1 hypothetical protein [Alkalicoccobacillus gibsonii]
MNEEQERQELLKQLNKADKLFKKANPNPKKLEVNANGNVELDLRDPSDRRWYEG